MLCSTNTTTSESILISASEDQTIFIYNIFQSANGITLSPIGFVRTNAITTCLNCFHSTENNVKNKFNFLSFSHFISVFYCSNHEMNWCDFFCWKKNSTALSRCCRCNSDTYESTFFQWHEKQRELVFAERCRKFNWNYWGHGRSIDAPNHNTNSFDKRTDFMDSVEHWHFIWIQFPYKATFNNRRFRTNMPLFRSVSVGPILLHFIFLIW